MIQFEPGKSVFCGMVFAYREPRRFVAGMGQIGTFGAQKYHMVNFGDLAVPITYWFFERKFQEIGNAIVGLGGSQLGSLGQLDGA